jgi:hypothetical protein
MHGKWVLVRMKGKGEKQPAWLLIKERRLCPAGAGIFCRRRVP